MINNENIYAFTLTYDGYAERIITPIKIYPYFREDEAPLKYEIYMTNALWDTGAERSIISKNVAEILQLKPVGEKNIMHAGGLKISNIYLVNILLPNNVEAVKLSVYECLDVKSNFEAIIGMDIITRGDFIITNQNGKTTMSFRTPSIYTVDYVDG
jgi:hypothetical protein